LFELKRQSGLSMLEVLIALIVFSIGMLGTAALVGTAVRNNHGAYLRSQGGYLAQNISDRMRANIPGVQASSYDTVALGGANGGTPPTCTLTGLCTPQNRAALDIINWQNNVANVLPAGQSSISRAGDLFTITVQWTQASGVVDSFQLVSQP